MLHLVPMSQHASQADHTNHNLQSDPIIRSKAGIKVVLISFAILFVASIIQFLLFRFSHSVALLTDVIHNTGDSLTAVPLGLAFLLKSRRGERLAGFFIVVIIFLSALLAGWQVVEKFIHPYTPTHLWYLFLAGIVGVIGNELAAYIRWNGGKKLKSAALIADGNHAKADGIVSAGIILSSILIAFGFPIADPIIGCIITFLILHSAWESYEVVAAS